MMALSAKAEHEQLVPLASLRPHARLLHHSEGY